MISQTTSTAPSLDEVCDLVASQAGGSETLDEIAERVYAESAVALSFDLDELENQLERGWYSQTTTIDVAGDVLPVTTKVTSFRRADGWYAILSDNSDDSQESDDFGPYATREDAEGAAREWYAESEDED